MEMDHYSQTSLAEHRTRRQSRSPQGWCCLIYCCTDSLNLTAYFREHQSRETLLLITALRKHQLAMSSPHSQESPKPPVVGRRKGGWGHVRPSVEYYRCHGDLSVKWDMNCRTNSQRGRAMERKWCLQILLYPFDVAFENIFENIIVTLQLQGVLCV